MKKRDWIFIGVLVVLCMAFIAVSWANAQDTWPWSPDEVEVFEMYHLGMWCITDHRADGPHTQCFCPCEAKTKTIEVEVIKEVEVCTDECCDQPDPTPVPTEKPKCNSGRGNDSEGLPDCDPGNSGDHNQGGD